MRCMWLSPRRQVDGPLASGTAEALIARPRLRVSILMRCIYIFGALFFILPLYLCPFSHLEFLCDLDHSLTGWPARESGMWSNETRTVHLCVLLSRIDCAPEPTRDLVADVLQLACPRLQASLTPNASRGAPDRSGGLDRVGAVADRLGVARHGTFTSSPVVTTPGTARFASAGWRGTGWATSPTFSTTASPWRSSARLWKRSCARSRDRLRATSPPFDGASRLLRSLPQPRLGTLACSVLLPVGRDARHRPDRARARRSTGADAAAACAQLGVLDADARHARGRVRRHRHEPALCLEGVPLRRGRRRRRSRARWSSASCR